MLFVVEIWCKFRTVLNPLYNKWQSFVHRHNQLRMCTVEDHSWNWSPLVCGWGISFGCRTEGILKHCKQKKKKMRGKVKQEPCTHSLVAFTFNSTKTWLTDFLVGRSVVRSLARSLVAHSKTKTHLFCWLSSLMNILISSKTKSINSWSCKFKNSAIASNCTLHASLETKAICSLMMAPGRVCQRQVSRSLANDAIG